MEERNGRRRRNKKNKGGEGGSERWIMDVEEEAIRRNIEDDSDSKKLLGLRREENLRFCFLDKHLAIFLSSFYSLFIFSPDHVDNPILSLNSISKFLLYLNKCDFYCSESIV